MIPEQSAIPNVVLILSPSKGACRPNAVRIVLRQAQDKGCNWRKACFAEAPGA